MGRPTLVRKIRSGGDQYPSTRSKPTMYDPSLLKDPKYSGPLAQLTRSLLRPVIPLTDFGRPPSGS